ncbi:DUF4249 domain-containing protein [Spirosoma sp. KNUC1025]|uniref:DUF4249 domain-containing protein n=1 Tax=Spirosoma sp. KNUC1025 TaxID=2894082 RepID=UPI003870AE5D|nr:DUF4249 domain-containing protein [Spirosoma sp. KNUC1025]
MRQFIVYTLTLLALAACIDQVQLPVRTEEPRLVVEGQITNEAPPYSVRLTYTGKYSGADGQNPANQYVESAQVVVGDDQGRSARFVSLGQGIYQTTDTTFRGQIGRTYSLSIALADGKRYASKPETMPDVPAIDSVSAVVQQSPSLTKPFVVEYGVNTLDPAGEKNYYRWTAYGITTRLSVGVPCSLGNPNMCNYRCWTTVTNDLVNIYSDEDINGNAIRNRAVLQVPVYNLGPQLMEVLQYGITQANYQFLKLYQQQNARTGSIFDPLPAPVVGNVTNVSNTADVARGYFAVTSLTRKRFRQQTYSASFYGALTSFIASQLIPPGDCRNTYGNVPVTEPEGW